MNKWESILLPTEAEKRQSIQMILDCGMPAPQRLTSALPELLRTVGIRGLFFGVGDCLFVAFLAAALLVIAFSASAGSFSVGSFFSAVSIVVFLTSPFLYGLLHLLTTWKEIMCGTYELTMTCRCSLRQLTALRMLVFGGISAVLSVIGGIALSVMEQGELSALRLISISFSSLFLFAAAQLTAEWKFQAPQSYAIVPAVWITLCITLLVIGEKAAIFMEAIPTVAFMLIALLSLICYLRTLQHYYFEPQEGVLSHAVG